MGENYYWYGGRLENLIGGKLHDICSSFINIVIIAIIWIRVGVVDDDVVFWANLLGFFVVFPALGGGDDEPKEIRSKDYIIIDDTDTDPDDSDDDYVDEAGADIMESSTDQFF